MSSLTRPSRLKAVCKHKQAHFSADEALSAALEVKNKGKLKRPEFSVYECTVCFHFHWGHNPLSTPTPGASHG